MRPLLPSALDAGTMVPAFLFCHPDKPASADPRRRLTDGDQARAFHGPKFRLRRF